MERSQEAPAAGRVAREKRREPFVGPRPYEEKDKELFFGRDVEADELTSLISAHQAVLLYAQSGVGKTSLLKASLIPALRKESFEVLPPARVRSQDARVASSMKVDNIYVFNALGDLSRGKIGASKRAHLRLAQFLQKRKQGDRSFFGFLRRRKRGAEADEVPSQCALIFDQFEELFTFYPERFEDRRDFFAQVGEALEADKLLRVVFSMREDYIAHLDPYVSALPEKLRTRFRLEPLREETALKAVTGPLDVEAPDTPRRRFERDVAEKLVQNLLTIPVKTPFGGVEEVKGEFVDPVQLQVVCQTLWRKLGPDDKTITATHLEQFGDLKQALADFYEEAVAEAAAEAGVEEADIRLWFENNLITSAGTRGIVYRGRNEKTVGGIPEAAVDALEDRHIIRAELRNDERWYELSHDRFIQPIQESNRKWRLDQPLAEQRKQELEDKARRWMDARRDKKLLLKAAALFEARNWLQSPEAIAVGYSPVVLAYVEASRTASQQRRMRGLWLGIAVATLGLISMSAMTVYALTQRRLALASRASADQSRAEALKQAALAEEAANRAEDARLEAENRQKEALEASKEAQEARAAAEQSKAEADRLRGEAEANLVETAKARDVAQTQTLFARSRELAAVSLREQEPGTSLRKAIEAGNLAHTDEAARALRAALMAPSDIFQIRFGEVSRETRDDSDFGEERLPTTGEALFGPEGKAILTLGSFNGERRAKLWPADFGEEARPAGELNNPLAVSPDGRYVITTTGVLGESGPLSVFDTTRPERPPVALGEGEAFAEASFSSDGKFVITWGEGQRPRVWKVETGELHATLTAPKDMIPTKDSADADNPVEFPGRGIILLSRDAKYAMTSHTFLFSGAPMTRLWDVASGAPIASLDSPDTPVQSAVFDDQREALVTMSAGRTARLWKIEGGKVSAPLALVGHTGPVHSADFSPDGDLLVTASEDKTARVWRTKDGYCVAQLLGHTSGVTRAVFNHAGDRVATVSGDATARVWEAQTGRELGVLRGHERAVESAVFSPDDEYLLTASGDGTARVWEADAERGVDTLAVADSTAPALAFSPDGRFLVAGADDGAHLLRVETRKKIGLLPAGTVFGADFSPDGKYLVTSGPSDSALVWDVSKLYSDTSDDELGRDLAGAKPKTLEHPRRPVFRVNFHPKDKKYVLTTCDDGSARVWDVSQEEPRIVATLSPEDERTDNRAMIGGVFSPDGEWVVTGSWDKTARLWDWRSARLLHTWRVYESAVIEVAFSPDGRLVATSELDGKVWVWDVQTKLLKQKLELPRTATGRSGGSVSFSQDGKLLLTDNGAGQAAQVWDTSTWKPVSELTGNTSEVYSSVFSPNVDLVATSNSAGVVRLYPRVAFAPFAELRVRAALRAGSVAKASPR